jgi:hypothetical protein
MQFDLETANVASAITRIQARKHFSSSQQNHSVLYLWVLYQFEKVAQSSRP